jgi:uncharacterized protein YbjT (DUF2867 family)
MSRKILLVGASGTLGGHTMSELVSRGADVRALVRAKRNLPGQVEQFIGDLGDRSSVEEALDGVQAAYYVSPHEADEVKLAENFIQACEAAHVRIVFAGVQIPDPGMADNFGRLHPHYLGKIHIGAAMAAAANDPIVISMAFANWAQNDELFKEDILNGEFAQPLHPKGVNRIDLRDVAEISASALLDPDFPGGQYVIAGPESLSGQQCADIWAAALARPVRYLGDDEHAWRPAIARRLTGTKQTDWLYTFEFLSTSEIPTDPGALKVTEQLLGHPPRNYRTYVRDTAREWLGSTKQ